MAEPIHFNPETDEEELWAFIRANEELQGNPPSATELLRVFPEQVHRALIGYILERGRQRRDSSERTPVTTLATRKGAHVTTGRVIGLPTGGGRAEKIPQVKLTQRRLRILGGDETRWVFLDEEGPLAYDGREYHRPEQFFGEITHRQEELGLFRTTVAGLIEDLLIVPGPKVVVPPYGTELFDTFEHPPVL
jgi:hypothetical protein